MKIVICMLFSFLVLPVSAFARTASLDRSSLVGSDTVLLNFLPNFGLGGGVGLIPVWSEKPLLPGIGGSDSTPLPGNDCEPEIDPFASKGRTSMLPGTTTTVGSNDCAGVVKVPAKPEGCVGDLACAPPFQYD